MAAPADPRHNNFDALRLVAAASVLFSHAFLIAEGNDSNEPMVVLSDRQFVLGHVGVFVFFTISGFLVTQSFEQTAAPWRYLAKRCLRIFPALALALVLTAFVLAPLVTVLPLGAYFGRAEPYLYVLNNLVFNYRTVHELPGVVFVDNPVGKEVNGSMWTLGSEFLMYLMVLLLGTARLLRLPVLLGLLALGLAFIAVPWLDPVHPLEWLTGPPSRGPEQSNWLGDWVQNIGGWAWLLGFFAAGMVLYRLRDKPVLDGRLAVLAVIGLVASVPLRLFILSFPIFGSYLVIYLARHPRLPAIPATRFGDLSYGLYIFGWPVEELVAWAAGGRIAWWQEFLLSLALTSVLAVLSWHLVEQPALRLKPRNRPASPSSASETLGAESTAR
jgi:peptidoglycan/LPS O-acetylase OafA/YrhL